LSSAFYKAFSHSADKKQQIQRVVKHIFVLCSLQGIFSNSADKTAKPSMLLNTFCAMLFARHFQIQQYADHNIPQRGYALLASSLLSKNQPIILVNPFNH
jgi:hypothetical protein